MPTIEVSVDDLLRAVHQLGPDELEQFVTQVLALRAQRLTPRLSPEEATLLERIQQSMPAELRRRYQELIARRQDETLTPEEHAELLRLSDLAEEWQAKQLQALVELAQVRKVPLRTLVDQMGVWQVPQNCPPWSTPT